VVLKSSKRAPAAEPQAPVEEEEARAPAPSAPPSALLKGPQSSKGTGCAPCTSDHLSTCARALSEALRFARTRGVEDPEVMKRQVLCIGELNAWERLDTDLDPQRPLAPAEKEFLHRWLPKARDLRQRLNEAFTLEDLEKVNALANQLAPEAFKEMRQLRPPVMSKIEAEAKRWKAGEISRKEALGQLTEWWRSEKSTASAMTTSPSNPSKTEPLPSKPEVPKEIKFFPDSSEDYRRAIDRTGLRPQLDKVFREAIARANGK